jgi:inner membrane transporter RhtA
VLLAIGSVQLGSALARGLFDRAGSNGTVTLRTLFAALVLLALSRPSVRGLTRRQLLLVAAFGVSLAAMNALFYAALARVPLGIAVSLEFLGPLAVAIAGSRRPRDLAWVALAAAGVVLLAYPGATSAIDLAGALLAVGAGAFWAAYILLSARTGKAFPDGSGLALAMGVAATLLLPIGIADAGDRLLDAHVLLVGAGVAMLSSAIPYSLELAALRRLPPRVFGILLSLEPAVAALAGLVILNQSLKPRELAGIALVVLASAGAAGRSGEAAPEI